MNRAFAIAMVYGHQKAIQEAEKLQLTASDHYHKLLGYLYEMTDARKAIDHYTQAAQLTKAKAAKQVLERKIVQLAAGSG